MKHYECQDCGKEIAETALLRYTFGRRTVKKCPYCRGRVKVKDSDEGQATKGQRVHRRKNQ